MERLRRIQLRGFKSIKSMDLELASMNVLVGVNGAGKSNLVSFFKLLNEMMGERLQTHIATTGRAQSILHFGIKGTAQLAASLEFEDDRGIYTYQMQLVPGAGGSLVFAAEHVTFAEANDQQSSKTLSLGSGHDETRLHEESRKDEPLVKTVRHFLNSCRVFHFHDTSPTAAARQYCYIGDNRWLKSDAGNLAAVLYELERKEENTAYRRIVRTVQRIAPFFHDFELESSGTNNKEIILNWRQKDSGQIFGPHQLSDGTLRAISLVTLLLQPIEQLPNLIVVDEPELGLHPAAKTIIAGLLKKASHHCQILVATQSAALLDAFDPEDVIVVERDARESVFRRLDAVALDEWLDEYTVGELWEKNVLGGGPF